MKEIKTNNQALLHNLVQCSLQTKPIQAVKIKEDLYKELDIFRQHIEIKKAGSGKRPYTTTKNKVFVYRSIFFGLGAIFCILAGMILFSMPSYPFFFQFGYYFTARNFMAAFSFLLACGSFSIGAFLRAETEASKQFLRSAIYNLSKAYERKRVQHGVEGLFHFGHKYTKVLTLKQSYQDAKDKIHEHYEDLFHLFERIAQSTILNAQARENLLNQALLEFHEKLHQVVHVFKNG